jgi:hypothetical protein
VRDLLTDLDDGAPCVVGETLLTIGTLLVGLDELDFKGLLQDGTLEGFGLNGDLHLDTARMGFCPDERGVDDADLCQTAQLAKTQGQEFARFGLSDEPLVGRRQPTLTISALVKSAFSLDALGDIDGKLDTIVTQGAGCDGAVNGSTTVATENARVKVRTSSRTDMSEANSRSVGHLALLGRHRHRVEIHRHGDLQVKVKNWVGVGEVRRWYGERRGLSRRSRACKLFSGDKRGRR